MKKITIIAILVILLAALVACSKTGTATSGGTDTAGTAASLSQEMQLLIGTIKLENTGQAVTADQAAKLLPLWQALQSLETSGTAATEEINAVISQIQETMTADQDRAITDMNLTRQDELSTMQSLGLSTNFSSGTPVANGTPGAMDMPGGNGTAGGMPSGGAPSGGMPSGGGPVGGMPSGGPQGSSGSGLSQSQIATMQAKGTPQAMQSMGSIDQVPQPLLNALISLLQKKIAS